ncbi:MAG: imidazolonepropionase [Gammaproteobacteria bacterium]
MCWNLSSPMAGRLALTLAGIPMPDHFFDNVRFYPTADGEPLADCFAVEDGRICSVGEPVRGAPSSDLGGRLVMPGLVDCHTHLIWAGDRADEFAMRAAGSSYADIARAGGGILSTVRAVRAASEDELLALAMPRLAALASEGVTTVEIKSGYGLSLDQELKMLRVGRRLGQAQPVRIVTTFLGAHAIPPGRQRDEYLDEVVENMLPAVAESGLADAVDVFVEDIAFSVADMERLFEEARGTGLVLRAHTGQLSDPGATAAAASLGAVSCDHLEFADASAAASMARHGTVAVLLPGAWYCLRETRRPPVDLFRQHGVPMAVASDANPGSSPVVSLLTAMHMAGVFFGLTPEEILAGATRHAARALGRPGGVLEAGMPADFAVWDLDRPGLLAWQLGALKPDQVYVGGKAL